MCATVVELALVAQPAKVHPYVDDTGAVKLDTAVNVPATPLVNVCVPNVVLPLLKVTVTVQTGAAVSPAQVQPEPALLHAIHAFPTSCDASNSVESELAVI